MSFKAVDRAGRLLRRALLKDEPDNRILECTIAAQADQIVTGDRHLLVLKRHANSAILSLADFLAALEK